VAVVIGVHGIAQQRSDAQRQSAMWSDALRLGLFAAGFPEQALPSLAVSFYGHVFTRGSRFLGVDDSPVADEEAAFLAEALDELAEGFSEQELCEMAARGRALGPPALMPPALLRRIGLVDARWGHQAGKVIIRVLRQVYAYLFREAAGTEIRRIVAAEIGPETQVLIGHSLGSVVGYDLLRRGMATAVSTLVTLGSPLSWATVRRALRGTRPDLSVPEGVAWRNVFDPWDVVTGGRGLEPPATDYQVHNGRVDPHALVGYLRQPATARLVLAGAARSGSAQ